MLVKICGLRTTDAAQAAIDSGADLLGVIMVPNRKRTCSPAQAAEISARVAAARKMSAKEIVERLHAQTFSSHTEYFEAAQRLISENGPFLVGVFRNQSVEEVFQLADKAKLDFIQLHGSENVHEYTEQNTHYGIIKRYVVPDHKEEMATFFPSLALSSKGGFFLPLLDSEAGGEGKAIDWTLINELDGTFLLAGGLKPENLPETKPYLRNVVGFDVSGGVEDENGEKNLDKIKAFVKAGKGLSIP